MINITLAGAVARRFPKGDVDKITGEMLAKLKSHGVRLLQDGEVLLAIAESLTNPTRNPANPGISSCDSSCEPLRHNANCEM